jgi:hypothetical protein
MLKLMGNIFIIFFLRGIYSSSGPAGGGVAGSIYPLANPHVPATLGLPLGSSLLDFTNLIGVQSMYRRN